MEEVGDEVAFVALGQYMVFPRAPDRPFGIADVARIVLANDLVVIRAVAVVSAAVDHVRNDPMVHVGVVVEVALGVDAIEAGRECVGVEVGDFGDAGRSVDSPIAEIPVVVTCRVVGVDAVVRAHDLDTGIADAVMVGVPVAGNHAVRVLAAGGRDGRGCDEHEAEECGGDQDEFTQGQSYSCFLQRCERSKCFAPTAEQVHF